MILQTHVSHNSSQFPLKAPLVDSDSSLLFHTQHKHLFLSKVQQNFTLLRLLNYNIGYVKGMGWVGYKRVTKRWVVISVSEWVRKKKTLQGGSGEWEIGAIRSCGNGRFGIKWMNVIVNVFFISLFFFPKPPIPMISVGSSLSLCFLYNN